MIDPIQVVETEAKLIDLTTSCDTITEVSITLSVLDGEMKRRALRYAALSVHRVPGQRFHFHLLCSKRG